jgi:hypothetical protein
MHYKTNRQNHDFQIAYFLAGSCQTPDAAWSLLCDQRDDRRDALKMAEAAVLKRKVQRIRLEQRLSCVDECERMEAEAALLELDAGEATMQKNIAGAQAELAMIERCMAVLEPLRKYGHLPDAEAHEAAQAEEWKLQLMHTAQNQLLMTGSVAPDHFATMRMHPAFKAEMLPFLNDMRTKVLNAQGDLMKLETTLTAPKSFDLPKLLASE